MTMPCERAWCLSIVLAFLLVRHSLMANINNEQSVSSTDAPYTQYKGNGDKFDLVDVAQQQDQLNNGATGYTSRFYTTGEVDDSFWLKHLGEDYKHAIHLQVGNDERYNGVYNMTEDGSAYKVQHLQISKENPVQKSSSAGSSNVGNKNDTSNEVPDKYNPKYREDMYHANPKNTTDTPSEQKESSFVFVLGDDSDFANTNYKSKHRSNLDKYSKFQHIRLRYSSKNHNNYKKTDDKAGRDSQNDNDNSNNDSKTNNDNDNDNENDNDNDSNNQDNRRVSTEKSNDAPVVVNLPETEQKTVEVTDHETPVVVQMPPVIYHHKSSFTNYKDEAEDLTPTQTETHTHAHTPTQTFEYERTPNTNTKYNEYSQQQHSKYQQQNQQYSQYASSYYKNNNDGASRVSYPDQNAYPSNAYNTITSTHEYEADNGYSDYQRVSRSCRALFEEGL